MTVPDIKTQIELAYTYPYGSSLVTVRCHCPWMSAAVCSWPVLYHVMADAYTPSQWSTKQDWFGYMVPLIRVHGAPHSIGAFMCCQGTGFLLL